MTQRLHLAYATPLGPADKLAMRILGRRLGRPAWNALRWPTPVRRSPVHYPPPGQRIGGPVRHPALRPARKDRHPGEGRRYPPGPLLERSEKRAVAQSVPGGVSPEIRHPPPTTTIPARLPAGPTRSSNAATSSLPSAANTGSKPSTSPPLRHSATRLSGSTWE